MTVYDPESPRNCEVWNPEAPTASHRQHHHAPVVTHAHPAHVIPRDANGTTSRAAAPFGHYGDHAPAPPAHTPPTTTVPPAQTLPPTPAPPARTEPPTTPDACGALRDYIAHPPSCTGWRQACTEQQPNGGDCNRREENLQAARGAFAALHCPDPPIPAPPGPEPDRCDVGDGQHHDRQPLVPSMPHLGGASQMERGNNIPNVVRPLPDIEPIEAAP